MPDFEEIRRRALIRQDERHRLEDTFHLISTMHPINVLGATYAQINLKKRYPFANERHWLWFSTIVYTRLKLRKVFGIDVFIGHVGMDITISKLYKYPDELDDYWIRQNLLWPDETIWNQMKGHPIEKKYRKKGKMYRVNVRAEHKILRDYADTLSEYYDHGERFVESVPKLSLYNERKSRAASKREAANKVRQLKTGAIHHTDESGLSKNWIEAGDYPSVRGYFAKKLGSKGDPFSDDRREQKASD